MSLAPQTFEEAKLAFKPLRRSRMTRKASSSLKTSPVRRKAPKRAKRKKVPTRKALIKKIDALVFQIVCLMYAKCVECGSDEKPTTGHVLSRRSYATRWDFRNVFRQCWPCNYKAAMTAAASYHLWFVKKFGVEAFDTLYQDWTKGRKYTRLELQNLVPEFEAHLAELQSREESPK